MAGNRLHFVGIPLELHCVGINTESTAGCLGKNYSFTINDEVSTTPPAILGGSVRRQPEMLMHLSPAVAKR